MTATGTAAAITAEESVLVVEDSNITESGFAIQATGSTVTITNLYMYRDTYGISVSSNSILESTHVEVIESSMYGIFIEYSTADMYDILISGGSDGIVVKASEANIRDVTVHDCTRNGIWGEDAHLEVFVASIYGNEYGFYFTGTEFEIRSADITANTYGIYATRNTHGDIYFSNITGNTLHGIYNDDPDDYIYAFYCWWGAAGGPEYTEEADDVDPEEVYGNVYVGSPLDLPYGAPTPTVTTTETETVSELSPSTIVSYVAYVSPILYLGISIAVAAATFVILFVLARKMAAATKGTE